MTCTIETAAQQGVRTGRRPNPTIDGPRDNTVCFMLSDGEKLAVDRLAFCMNITRSGLLASVVEAFVSATDTKRSRNSEKRLLELLDKCRQGVKERGELAKKTVVPERDVP